MTSLGDAWGRPRRATRGQACPQMRCPPIVVHDHGAVMAVACVESLHGSVGADGGPIVIDTVAPDLAPAIT